MSKQIAYSRVHLPDGTLLRRCVVEFDNQGVPLRYFPLTEELPLFCRMARLRLLLAVMH